MHAAPQQPSPTTTPAPAAGQTPAAAAPVTAQPDMEEIRRIYDRGKAKFDTADFRGAIVEWTSAYGMLPAVDSNREIRNDIAYNIATAQEKAYDTYKDPVHLRQARQLLQSFLDEYKSLYSPTPEAIAEVEKVKERIANLDAKIKLAESQPSPPPPVVNAEKKRQQMRVAEVFAADPSLRQRYVSGRGMIIGGAVLLAIGASSALLAIGVASNKSIGGRPLVITSAVVAVGGLVGGGVLLGFGVPKRRAAVAEARTRVAFVPTVTGRVAGLSLVGRF